MEHAVTVEQGAKLVHKVEAVKSESSGVRSIWTTSAPSAASSPLFRFQLQAGSLLLERTWESHSFHVSLRSSISFRNGPEDNF